VAGDRESAGSASESGEMTNQTGNGRQDWNAGVGSLVRIRRQAAGLTQQELADLAQVGLGTVRDLEQGRTRRPGRDSLTRLAAALGLDPARLQALMPSTAEPAGNDARRRQRILGLHLKILGPVEAWRDGARVGLGEPRQRAVLGLLALNPDVAVHRETFIDTVWGDDPPESAAQMLQAYVSRLRRILDPGRAPRDPQGLLVSGGTCYRLRVTGDQLDLLDFGQLVGRARAAASAGEPGAACDAYEQALALWRGEPVSDVDALRGHPAALQVSRACAAVVLEYTDLADQVGRADHALGYLADLAAREPLNEKVCARLMRTFATLGQQAAALHAYEGLRLRLDEQLGVLPGPELAEAHLRVLRQEVPSADAETATGHPGLTPTGAGQEDRGGGTAGRPPGSFPGGESETAWSAGGLAGTCALIGRDGELAMLVRLMGEVAAGRGNSLLIEGEPGIGKSALVRAALAEAADVGCEVFWGAGDELGQALPLLPLLEGLRVREPSTTPRRNAIVRLLRGEMAADRGTDVSAVLAEQLLALVAEQCAVQPTILVIDDLQWADQASVTLWGRLARSARQVPLLLIGIMRPVPQRDDLLALRRAVGDAARLQLTGLTEATVAELVAVLVGGNPDAKLLRLAGGAAGNPLYITELVAALTRSSGVTITGAGAAELTSGSAPSSLSAAIADRLGFVSPLVREVLRAAALLGVDFAVRDVAVVLGRGVADLIPAVDAALAAGLLAESGNGLRFRHPLIRAALYDEMPEPVRVAWHRDAGRALAEAGLPPDRVARQLLRAVGGPGGASEPMDEWILDWLARTAELLVSQAPRAAAGLLRQAVANSPVGSAQHDRLVGRLADALYRVGDAAEAEQVANRALVHAVEPDLLVDLHWTLAQCRIQAGRSAESLATLNQALAAPGISARHRARLLVLTARTHSYFGQLETAARVATAALAAASEAGDNWAIGWALHVLTIVATMQGQTTDALPLFDRALAVTQANPALTDLRLLLQINQAVALGDLDRYEDAFAAARQARHLADRVGTVVRLGQAHSALGQLLFDTGRWDDALAEVEALHDDLKEPAAVCCDHGVAAVICFHRGEITAGRRHLTAAVPHAGRIGNRVVGPLALARSLDFEQAEALPEALAVLTAWFADSSEELEEVEDLLADAVRLATKMGDLSTAKTLAGQAAALTAESEIPHRQANALYCRGLLDHDAARLLAAAERYQAATRPLPSAKALEAAAEAFADDGDRGRARAAFTRAVEIYTSLGAAADVVRLRAMLGG
jgi:DNA-binding SARP family transcriptional activator/tetratricopeptide (TPR) repeat protein/DNA-binding transcriptional regulator YiaG